MSAGHMPAAPRPGPSAPRCPPPRWAHRAVPAIAPAGRSPQSCQTGNAQQPRMIGSFLCLRSPKIPTLTDHVFLLLEKPRV